MTGDLEVVHGVMPGIVLIGACCRFLWYSKKRRLMPGWRPFELQIIELLVILITGKRATSTTWQQIGFLTFSALVITLILLLPPARRVSSPSSPVRAGGIVSQVP